MTAPTTRETADHIGEANEKVSDHIGEATTMIDHAEMARLAEVLFTMAGRHQETYMAAATGLTALLSEIAALRGERDDLKRHRDRLAITCQRRLDDWRDAQAQATQAERQRDELRKALEPFAAFARVAEAKSRMALGKVLSDNEVIASISWEGGLGVLVMGHLRDALSMAPDAKGWGGLYRRSEALANQGADQ